MFASELNEALAPDVAEPLRGRLVAYGDALARANAKLNLTAARTGAAVAEHLRDALTLAPYVSGEYADVGSGGGFPAVPLALATGARTTCFESVGKKARALREIVAECGPVEVAVLAIRAETAGRDPAHRERYDCATARAVGSAPFVLELTIPLLRVGGCALLQRGRLDARERDAAADAALVLGAEIVEEIAVGGERRILRVVKRAPTGPRFPRKAGVPERRPLCLDPVDVG